MKFVSICQHLQSKHLLDNDCIKPLDNELAVFLHDSETWICSKCVKLVKSKTNKKCKCDCGEIFLTDNPQHLCGTSISLNIAPVIQLNIVPCSVEVMSSDSIPPVSFCALSGLSFEEILKKIRLNPVVTVKCIPKKCRLLFNNINTRLLKQIRDEPSNIEFHILYQMFPKCVLSKVNRNQRNTKKKRSMNQRQIDSIFDLLKL